MKLVAIQELVRAPREGGRDESTGEFSPREFLAPGPMDPSRGPEVIVSSERPIESPPKTIEVGPLYRDVDEVFPELVVDDVRPHSEDPAGWKRRDFLKVFSTTTFVATTGCISRPVEKAIPYVNQPEDVVPGLPTYYATACGECPSGCGLVVKTKAGRPIKVEGNPEQKISQGGSCALVQSTLQELYHPARPVRPRIRFGKSFAEVEWQEVYQHLGDRLQGKTRIGIIAPGSTGHQKDFFKEFLTAIGSDPSRLYTFESNSLFYTIAEAHKMAYGTYAMPRLDLTGATTVVGIGADFLELGISHVYYSKQYGRWRDQTRGKGLLVQFESQMSGTGGAADIRKTIAPGSELGVTLALAKALYDRPDARGSSETRAKIKRILDAHSNLIQQAYTASGYTAQQFGDLAERLLAAPSVVLAGGSDNFDANATNLQLAAIMVNELIGAYGKTLHLAEGWMVPPVQSGDIGRMLTDLDELEAVFVINTNPIFALPPAFNVAEKLKKIGLVISMQSYPNEVDLVASHSLVVNHFLESWGDAQPIAGHWTMGQPVVQATRFSEQAEDALMWIAASLNKPLGYKNYQAFLASKWQAVHDFFGGRGTFETFFAAAKRKGVGPVDIYATQTIEPMADFSDLFKPKAVAATGLKFQTPLDPRLQDGKGANRPILQEIGDAMTSIAWDTWVAISPATARNLGVRRNDVVEVTGPAGTIKVAVFPMPGLHETSVVVPRGNGHDIDTGPIEGGVGVNPLIAVSAELEELSGIPIVSGAPVKIAATGAIYRLAAMQKQNDVGNRTDIVKKVSFAGAIAAESKTVDVDTVPNLYPALPKDEYWWGMAIDLNKCTGCSACMAACAVENNVPQIGREEILKGREMHWIRLDRYFDGPVESPKVTYQPMLCQQCNHAPCEAVCPVYATLHDPEGLNTQVYNRCVGTRYCANACPYKVRRFNWWTHKWGEMGELAWNRNPRAMNPDVTVRTRGVMEKCTFCVQRIREAKHKAKENNRSVIDGEFQVACQQACPSDAIAFGNLQDPNSAVAKARRGGRSYLALNGDPSHGHYGLKTMPSVSYLSQVVIKEDSGAHHSE